MFCYMLSENFSNQETSSKPIPKKKKLTVNQKIIMVDKKACVKDIEVLNMNFQKLMEMKILNLFKINPLSTNPRKWSNKVKQFVGFADELFECV